MNDLGKLLDAWAQASRRGEAVVLATVVRVEGSAYRRPGARMLITSAGRSSGIVSGGCLETDLAERAAEVLAGGDPRTVVYDMRSPDDLIWGLGAGCAGKVTVLLERIAADAGGELLSFLSSRRERREAAAVATIFAVDERLAAVVGDRAVFAGSGEYRSSLEQGWLFEAIAGDAAAVLSSRRSRVRTYERDGGRAEALVEYIAPPIALFVFGAGADARPLVSVAAALGWTVRVYDPRPAFADSDRFPGAREVRCCAYAELPVDELGFDRRSAAVVMTHHFLHDVELMRGLLPTEAAYIGLIGPARRREQILRESASGGRVPRPEQLKRLYGPVGIDIGSETPEEIALSVAAEIQAVLSGAGAGFLRDRSGPLHDGPE